MKHSSTFCHVICLLACIMLSCSCCMFFVASGFYFCLAPYANPIFSMLGISLGMDWHVQPQAKYMLFSSMFSLTCLDLNAHNSCRFRRLNTLCRLRISLGHIIVNAYNLVILTKQLLSLVSASPVNGRHSISSISVCS